MADRLAELAAGTGATVSTWSPKDLPGAGPWAVVGIPTIERKGLDEEESQLGALDWRLSYPVVFYVGLDDLERAQVRATELVEAFVLAVDADGGLHGQALDAKVTRAEPVLLVNEGETRPHLVYETTVEVLRLVDP